MNHISNMSKIVHDKVSYSGSFKPMKYNCDGGPLNALAVNKDFSQVVVAGRSVFKVLNIKDDCFTENANLRVGKHRNINLSYSAADVAWHPSDENVLASAAVNGYVVLWNLSMNGKSKQTHTFSEHKRSVNRVEFHESEHNQLLSASQDGVVMIHDIRDLKKACLKFGAQETDSVRDAQFCPHSAGYFTFAAAYESGGVQTWDMRRPDRCERRFMAHNGPVFSLDWHPADKTWWLATAGRDTMIQVWDIGRGSDRTTQPVYSITNIAPVARVKWRPHRKHHISSCSLHVDHSINVWDVGRPYIPFAAFDGHVDVGTGIKWRDDCHAFLTCGRDGYIIQHTFAEAKRPADNVSLAGVDISVCGDIGCAFFDKKEHSGTGSGGRNKKPRSRQFMAASSSFCIFENCFEWDNEEEDEITMMHGFVEMALKYQLEGASLVDMCWNNGNVAEAFNKPQVSQSWRMLATLYSPFLTSQTGPKHIPRTSSLGKSATQQERQDHPDKVVKPALKRPREKEKKKGNKQVMSQNDATSGSNEESSEVEGESSEVDKSGADIHTGTNFLFGDGVVEELNPEFYHNGEILDDNYGWKLQDLPSEAIQLQHELTSMTGSDPLMIDETDFTHNPIMDSLSATEPSNEVQENCEAILTVKDIPDAGMLDFSSTVADMISYFAELGDVQTVVTMLIVLGDHIRPHIDEAYQESWFFAYIDLLGRYELWTVANTVIKQSKLMSVCSLNQESTVIHNLCSKCSRPMERAGWLCDKCKKVSNLCSVCHHPVKGLMVWCQGCCHGGHIDHIKEWMAVRDTCSAGCGHRCEYV